MLDTHFVFVDEQAFLDLWDRQKALELLRAVGGFRKAGKYFDQNGGIKQHFRPIIGKCGRTVDHDDIGKTDRILTAPHLHVIGVKLAGISVNAAADGDGEICRDQIGPAVCRGLVTVLPSRYSFFTTSRRSRG